MDDFTRGELNLARNKVYDFDFREVTFIGQLCWVWSATEIGYQVAS
jgi:hypothetical protein